MPWRAPLVWIVCYSISAKPQPPEPCYSTGAYPLQCPPCPPRSSRRWYWGRFGKSYWGGIFPIPLALYAPCAMLVTPLGLYALCAFPLSSALCSLPYVLYPMPYAPCALRHACHSTGVQPFFKQVSHKAPSTHKEGGAFLFLFW